VLIKVWGIRLGLIGRHQVSLPLGLLRMRFLRVCCDKFCYYAKFFFYNGQVRGMAAHDSMHEHLPVLPALIT
jgi:hypothetical protein